MSDTIHHRETLGEGVFDSSTQDWAHIRDALRGLRFGHITITVQDGVVVQIDRLEKRRVLRENRGRELPSRGTSTS